MIRISITFRTRGGIADPFSHRSAKLEQAWRFPLSSPCPADLKKGNEGQVKYDGSSFRRIVDRKINDARTPDKTTSSLRPEEFFGAGPSIRLRKAHSA